jgi:hypothetical protein
MSGRIKGSITYCLFNLALISAAGWWAFHHPKVALITGVAIAVFVIKAIIDNPSGAE